MTIDRQLAATRLRALQVTWAYLWRWLVLWALALTLWAGASRCLPGIDPRVLNALTKQSFQIINPLLSIAVVHYLLKGGGLSEFRLTLMSKTGEPLVPVVSQTLVIWLSLLWRWAIGVGVAGIFAAFTWPLIIRGLGHTFLAYLAMSTSLMILIAATVEATYRVLNLEYAAFHIALLPREGNAARRDDA